MIVYRTPGLIGIEIWHGLSNGVELWTLREPTLEYFHSVLDFLIRVHEGRAETADLSDTARLQAAAGFRRLVVCGGDALHPLLCRALSNRPLPFAIEIGEFAAYRGALAIFNELGFRNGVALDLGQTQLKVITSGGHMSIERDAGMLPFGVGSLDRAVAHGRLRAFVREGLEHAAVLNNGEPDGIVLGLPVALDNNGVAQPATYPGLCGPVIPIFEPLFRLPWILINDAVLAARGFSPPPGEKRLVVTMGFGLGGALWTGQA